MPYRILQVTVFLIAATLIAGCGGRVKPASIPGYTERGIRLIAVMPVKAATADPQLTRLMRERIVETLYFKGYPKIPSARVDEKLAAVYNRVSDGGSDVPPQAVRSLLAADAVLYVALAEFGTSKAWLYAATTLSAVFELRDGKTGETLWKTQVRKSERNMDITSQRLERTVYSTIEPALQAMVEQALQGLPDGPDVLL